MQKESIVTDSAFYLCYNKRVKNSFIIIKALAIKVELYKCSEVIVMKVRKFNEI